MKKFTSGILRSALLIFIGLCCAQSLKAQVPVPEFTGTPVSGCAPLVVQFRDQSTGNPVFWNWDFGNGSLSNIQNPTAVYIIPGRYTVTLVVRNANGTNAITKTDYIVVNPSPGADFTANILTGCAPVNIQFTDASVDAGGTIVNWEWNFGDGSNISTQQNPLHQFDSTGFYTISLKVTSSTGCTNIITRPRYIRVVPGVTADFSFKEPGTCRPPFLVAFKDESSVPGNPTYLWDFGNATTSTQPNPIANYAASGTYTVRLNVQSDFGCGDTVQKTITINGTTTAINGPDSVCLNTTVNFQNASIPTPQSSVWDFGNGKQSNKRNDTTSYSVPGSYAVKLINNYDLCSDSVVKIVYVRPRPTVDFTANSQISCRTPFVVNFTDISPNAVSWQWNFGDGGTSTAQNPSHQYNAEGSFNVTLNITDNRGCVNTITKTAFIRIQKPTVSLPGIPTGGCAPFSFTPTSIINSLDPVATYFWDFGDGFTTTNPNPTHVYSTVGVYTVKLRITTTGGCTDSLVVVDAVKVGTPPIANFTAGPTTVCASTNVSFTDMSAPADAWLWSFGDGTQSTEQNPIHAYNDTGTFTVSLIAYNNGCGQTMTRTQYIRALAPVPLFTTNATCNNKLERNFFNFTILDPSLPTTYLWEFGDPANSTSNASDPTFVYPAIGTYLVRLTVTNGTCSNTYPLSINVVNDIADFTLSKTAACVNEVVTASAINSDPSNIAVYEWSIDGAPYVFGNRDFQFSFSSPGSHSVTLRIWDVNSCSNTKTVNSAVTVTGPVAGFSTSNVGCNNTAIVFNDLSNSANAIVEWFWDFGDGSTQTFTSAPFTHQYQNPGTYLVALRVKDNQGCMDTFSLATPILITDPIPAFSADYLTVCPNTPINFADSSTGTGLTYNWSFGDGNTSTLQDPTHQYTGNDSVYSVKLVITDSIGCSDSIVKVNYINVRRPKPAFDAFDTSAICPPIETRFVFKGQDYDSFLWDFGDGDISTLTNPKHFYNGYGSFTVKLYLTGFGGCLDSAMKTVNIYNPYTSTTLQYNPITSCNSLMVDFDITTPPHTTFTFNAGDGFIDSSQAKVFQHYYQSLGYYAPYVALKDNLDCEVLIGGPNTIRILGALPFFGMDKKAFCDSGTILFQNFTIGNDPITNSVWDFGDGVTSTIKDPSHSYTAPGTYYPSLTVTTEAGCVKTLEDTVHIYATPEPTIVSDTVICINELIPIQGVLAYPDSAVRWAWNFGNGGTSTLQNPSTRYSNAGTFNIQVATTNVLGCSSNTTKSVRVVPNPVINVLGNPVISVGTGINLPVTYGPGVVSYTWVPPTNLDCTNCATPFASPKKTTKYTVNVTDVNDCPASADIEVVVVCNEKNYFLPNTFSPNNDGNNDVFYPRGSGLARVHSLRIFNRWGELVFERRDFAANDPTLGWDGTHKGRKADPDVYVYIVEWVCDNSVIIPSRGNVALIR